MRIDIFIGLEIKNDNMLDKYSKDIMYFITEHDQEKISFLVLVKCLINFLLFSLFNIVLV